MKRLLCVHQGYELYGSDRMFLLSLKALKRQFPDAGITVHLPKKGELFRAIAEAKLANEVIFKPLTVVRKSDIKKLRIGGLLKGLFTIPAKVNYCNKFDLVYINSIVVIDYLIASKFTKAKAVLHIHEIPPKSYRSFFQVLIKSSGIYSFFITESVKNYFKAVKKGEVILNGIKGLEYLERDFRNPLNLLQIGRVNGWKGQDLLLRSLAYLKRKTNIDFKLKIVGNVFEDQSHFLNELKNIVKNEGIEEHIEFCDFQADPSGYYYWADIVIVPSKNPEPFGLVAIEAMSAGCVVIAAEHGGLKEIFEHTRSGIYFKPNSIVDLANSIEELSSNPTMCKSISITGHKLFRAKFTEEGYIERYLTAIRKIVGIN